MNRGQSRPAASVAVACAYILFAVACGEAASSGDDVAGDDMGDDDAESAGDGAEELDLFPPGPPCEDLFAEWQSCGGNPVGSWRATRFCFDDAAFDPLRGTCPESSVSSAGDAWIELGLEADGDFVLRGETGAVAQTLSFPLACYGGSSGSCTGSAFDGTCEHDEEICTCALPAPSLPAELSGDFFVATGTLLLDTPEGALSLLYCVGADRREMWVRLIENEQGVPPFRAVLRR